MNTEAQKCGIRGNIKRADCIIKCVQKSITNTLKLADGYQIKLQIFQDKEKIKVDIANDGFMLKLLSIEDGLSGTKERTLNLNGDINISFDAMHFYTPLCLSSYLTRSPFKELS